VAASSLRFVYTRARERRDPGRGSESPGYAVKLFDLPHATAITVASERVGRLDDAGVGDGLGAKVAGAVDDGCAHRDLPSPKMLRWFSIACPDAPRRGWQRRHRRVLAVLAFSAGHRSDHARRWADSPPAVPAGRRSGRARRQAGSAPAVPGELQRTRPALHGQDGRRSASASLLVGLWDEHELSLRRRALEQLMGTARIGERQALGHDRADLALTE
jgi:hypothetical protein